MQATDTAEPRLKRGLPFLDYVAWEGVNASALKYMDKSPAHVRHYLDAPQERTASQVLGQAIHTAVLEPQLWDEQYAVAPKVDRRTKAGKAAWAEFCEMHVGREHLSEADAEVALSIAARLRDPGCGAEPWLSGQGENELSLQALDPCTGLLLKARVDRVYTGDGGPVLLDLKSCESVDPPAFAYAMRRYGYDIQAVHYQLVFELVTGVPPAGFRFVAVEKSAPFACRIFSLSAETEGEARERHRRLLERWAECQDLGEWPDASNEEVTL